MRDFGKVAVLALALSCVPLAGGEAVDAARFVRELSSLGSRLPGFEGNRAAVEKVKEALSRIPGLEVGTQRFIVPAVKEDAPARLSATDASGKVTIETEVRALWPDGLYPATLPEGVEGRLFYAGKGRLEDFDGKRVAGAVVLMDFACGSQWLNAAMLGAAAVVFIEPEEAYRGEGEDKFLRTWLDFPRYWVSRRTGLRLKSLAERGARCRLEGASRFGSEVVENVYAFLPGEKKEFSRELVVLGAYLDGSSVVPGLAPGAEAAGNLAVFLNVARAVAERGSPRPVLFLVTNAHTYGLAGARYFYDLLNADDAELGRRRYRDLELNRYVLEGELRLADVLLGGGAVADLEEAASSYMKEAPLDELSARAAEYGFRPTLRLYDEPGELASAMLEDYRTLLQEETGRIGEELMVLRLRKEEDLTPEQRARKKALAEREAVIDRIFNKLRGAGLYADLPADEKAGVDAEYRRLLGRFRKDVSERLADVRRRIGIFEHNGRLRRLLQDFRQMIYIGLDVSSRAERLVLVEKGWMYNQRGNPSRAFAPLAADLMRVALEAEAGMGAAPGSFLADGIRQVKGRTWDSYLACRMAFDAEVATAAGEAKTTRVKSRGVTIAASGDARVFCDTPHDTPERMDFRRLERFGRFLERFVPEALQEDGLCRVLNHDDRFVSWADLRGEAMRRAGRSSLFARMPVRGGVVQWYHWTEKTFAGVRAEFLSATDFRGGYFLPGVRYYGEAYLEAAKHDAETGRPVFVYDKASDGVPPGQDLAVRMTTPHKEKSLVLFEARPLAFFDLVDQRFLTLLTSLQVLDARTNNIPLFYGSQLRREPVAVVWGKPRAALKIIIKAGEIGVRMALLNVTPEELASGEKVRGRGFPLERYDRIPYTSYQAALDMFRMDEWRLKRLLDRNIRNRRIEDLHEEAGAYLKAADKAKAELRYSGFMENARSAWGLESRAYPDVRATQKDTIAGVVFYLFLVLPFAFFLERLLFGFTKIEHQIMAFFGLFVGTFLILKQVHPAFELANAPAMVLLAFVMLALSIIVISIIYRKFSSELKAIQEDVKGRRSADVNRLSASAVAVRLGISNMRRRKMRTLLTCVTIIILTFTVLSFSSIVEGISKPKVALGTEAPYSGILLRNPDWSALDPSVYPVIRNRYGASAGREGFVVAPRAWYVSQDPDKPTVVEVATERGKVFKAKAAMGMSAGEAKLLGTERTLVSGKWLSSDDGLECLLPRGAVEALGFSPSSAPGREVRLFGMTFTIAGVFDEDRFVSLADQDGEELTPVDYEGEQASGQAQGGGGRPEEVALLDRTLGKRYEHMLPGSVVVVPYRTLMNCGGTLRSVAVGFPPEVDAAAEVDRLLQRIERVVYAGIDGESFIYSTASSQDIKGLGNLLVPLLIASLIVFNTMVGSVYERVREIGTLSALGLAPVHIGLLFLAESAVYAVIGAIAGYLLGQATAWTFTHVDFLGRFFTGLELNYSSSSTVMVTMLVMGAVIVSTLYPASAAARIAVPSAERHWRIPESRGDALAMELPFTFGMAHATGIMAFVKSFLDAHVDSTVGNFYVREINFRRLLGEDGSKGYGAYFMAWLTPYDLGVSQEVQLILLPRLDQYVMYMVIYRMSGFDSAWKRTNRTFLNALRKQLLLWRTLSEQERAELSEEGKGLFEGAEEEKVVLV